MSKVRSLATFGLILFLLLGCSKICFSQNNIETHLSESFENLTDTLIKKEIALFNFKGSSFLSSDSSVKKPSLREIPLRNCNGNTISLNKGNTFITLRFSPDLDNRYAGTNKLDSIFLVTHSHYWVKIPKSAYRGLQHPLACNSDVRGKRQRFVSAFYKAFESVDRRQIYIYMIGGLDRARYEVTWIIQNDEYYGRIIDDIWERNQ